MLTPSQIEEFINKGFIKIENAFSAALAHECCALLWGHTKCDPDDPGTWKVPVIRVGELSDPPFLKAAHSPILNSAFDQLVGKNNWLPRSSMGSFPIRFPSSIKANDTGWHVDAGFPGDVPDDYMNWRINVHSKGRGLLMLFLFSSVTERDAPTKIKTGSHFEVASILYPYNTKGLSFMDLAERLDPEKDYEITFATGDPGTVYLCHPFIVHAAQDHEGSQPKFMAQPALMTRTDLSIDKEPRLLCPVEKAIVKALS